MEQTTLKVSYRIQETGHIQSACLSLDSKHCVVDAQVCSRCTRQDVHTYAMRADQPLADVKGQGGRGIRSRSRGRQKQVI